MEISNVVSNQYAFFIPVALVIICAVLVFAFGFKSSVEPPNFKQLSLLSDVKKTVKKRKVKDKKSQSNGHATVIIEDSSNKTLKQVNKIEVKPKEKKSEVKSPAKTEKKKENKVGKENQLILNNKKNEVKYDERIEDEGEWEIAYTKKDKKNRKKEEGETLTAQTPERTPKNKRIAEKEKKIEEAAIETIKKKAEETQKVPEVVKPEEKAEEQKDQGKKQKNVKKAKQEKEEETVVEAIETPQEEQKPAEPAAVEIKETVVESEEKKEEEPVAGAAFDELGDVWKEAPQKKSKKKVRKD